MPKVIKEADLTRLLKRDYLDDVPVADLVISAEAEDLYLTLKLNGKKLAQAMSYGSITSARLQGDTIILEFYES